MWVMALVSSVVTAAQSRIRSVLHLDGRGSSHLSRYWWADCVCSRNGVTWLVEMVGRTGAGNHRGFKRHTQHCLEDCTHKHIRSRYTHALISRSAYTHFLCSANQWGCTGEIYSIRFRFTPNDLLTSGHLNLWFRMVWFLLGCSFIAQET